MPAAKPMFALGVRIAAIASLATMAALVKVASAHDIHLAEIIFWRQGLTLPIALATLDLTSGVLEPRIHELFALSEKVSRA